MCHLPARALALLFLFAVGACLLPARAAEPADKNQEIEQRLLRSACWVLTAKGSGSGWLLDLPRKQIITNYHVVEQGDTATVYFPEFDDGKVIGDRGHYLARGKRLSGKVLYRDSKRDLALLHWTRSRTAASE